jgi:hypothetical protein
MTAFKDLTGVEWQLEFDAFTFEDIRKSTGIDLAEQSGGGYMLIDSDAGKLEAHVDAAQWAAREPAALALERNRHGIGRATLYRYVKRGAGRG